MAIKTAVLFGKSQTNWKNENGQSGVILNAHLFTPKGEEIRAKVLNQDIYDALDSHTGESWMYGESQYVSKAHKIEKGFTLFIMVKK